ncbi:MAG: ABC transporter substrate-binding protein [Syntrophobacteraceae bacterium]|jgi:NitT/TauT family transport system substrate-binding protein|nr:ABC transporter substrate-binding protein [Syntrophobacteraceae bacterium]
MMKNPRETIPPGARIVALSVLWLIVISTLHGLLNHEPADPGTTVRMGYMPVIANLAAPLVDRASRQSDLRFESIKFSSFAEMAEAFRAGHIEVAFIIAPLALALHQEGVPLKIVYIGTRHESTLVVGSDSPIQSMRELVGKKVAVPIRYSGHLLALRRYLRETGLGESSVQLIEIPPPDMPAALATGSIDGYFVGEPFASRSVQSGLGRRLMDVEQIWPEFICNLMIVRDELIRSHPERVSRLVSAAVRAGVWAQGHPDEAIALLADSWAQSAGLVRYTFTQSPNRFRFDLPVPSLKDVQLIAGEMTRAGLTRQDLDAGAMLDDRFALEAVARITPPPTDLTAICRKEGP